MRNSRSSSAISSSAIGGIARWTRTGESTDSRPGREIAFALQYLLQLGQHEYSHFVDHVAERGVAVQFTWLGRDFAVAHDAVDDRSQEES